MLARHRRPGPALSAAQLAAEIEWAKARLVGPDGYAEAAAAARPAARLGRPDRSPPLYRAYEDEKQQPASSTSTTCCAVRRRDERPGFAAAQRWRFRHLFVDEFQDVNPAPAPPARRLAGTGTDLCVVGDPHQAIYGWNGADAGFLVDFRRLYPSADVVVLDGNYRSTPRSSAARPTCCAGRGRGPHVRPAQADGPARALERHPTDRAEAVAIARAVRDRRTPRRPGRPRRCSCAPTPRSR